MKTRKRNYTQIILSICVIALLSAGIYFQFFAPKKPNTGTYIPNHSTLTDISYCGGHAQQKYDLMLPKEPMPNTPIVIHIHGGGWNSGDKVNGISKFYGEYFADSGIAFASLNYRLAPQFRYPIQNQDVACAIKDIASKAGEHGIDMHRVILFGDSAGGLLASMYALTEKNPDVTVRGVISFYGTADIVYQLTRKTHRNMNAEHYLGSTDLKLAQKASPLYQQIVRVPPFMFFHGEKDTTVTLAQAKALFDKIHAVEPKSEFITVKNAGHHFDDTTDPSRTTIRDMTYAFSTIQASSLAEITEQDVESIIDSESDNGTYVLPAPSYDFNLW